MSSASTLDLNDYKKNKEIGKGQYGKVYKIENKTTHKNYAAKINNINKTTDTSDEKDPKNSIDTQKITADQFWNEVDILSKVNYPTVVHFIGYSLTDFKGNNNPTIVTDFIPNSSLQKMLEDEVKCQAPTEWTGTSRYIALFGISLGMHHLRKLNIIHRDLKPDNILLNEFYYPVICDFGFSKIAAGDLTEFVTGTNLGTPSYKAPEIGEGSYNFKVDVFSFSIIAYQLMFCKTTDFDFDVSLINGVDVRIFFEKCHSKDPLMRPDFYDICCFITRSDFVENFDEIEINKMIDFFEFLEDKEPDLDADTLLFIGLFYLENGNGDHLNEAADYFLKSIDKGSRDAMYKYAEMLHEGNGIASDIKRAAELFKKSADLGQPDSMYSYSEMLLKGEGVKADKKEAEKYLMKSVELHQPEAMFKYAERLYNGDGVKADKKEAAKYFKMSADKGKPEAIFKYANIAYEGDGIEADKKQAAQYFQSSADRGNEEAMLKFATMSYVGDGININKEQAAEYFQLLAKRDNVNAMLKFATMSYEGDGIKVNKKEASVYFKKAANKDNQEAMYRYALMVYEGDGIDVDKKLAIEYFKRAVNKNHPEAMYKYAMMLYEGDGMTADKKQATKFFKELVEKGHLESLYQYALMIFKKEAAPIVLNKSLFPSLKMEDLNDQSLLKYKYGLCLINSRIGLYKDYFNQKRGINFLKELADKGNADAIYQYGRLLFNGDTDRKNPADKKSGVDYLKKAADANIQAANLIYANIKMDENLKDKNADIFDKAEAARYYMKLAEIQERQNTTIMPITEALYNSGVLLREGFGPETDKREIKEAIKADINRSELEEVLMKHLIPKLDSQKIDDMLKLLKLKKDSDFDKKLDELLDLKKEEGIYVNQALRYFQNAADKGDSKSMYMIASMIENGEVIGFGMETAKNYYKMSARKGNVDAMFKYACLTYKKDGNLISNKEAILFMKSCLKILGNDKRNKDKYSGYKQKAKDLGMKLD